MQQVVERPSEAELAALNERFERAAAEEILSWAVERFGDGLAVGASFGGPTGMVILHMLSRLQPDAFVFVLDTDYLFHETHETMQRAIRELRLTNVHVFKPALSHEEQARYYGAALWMRDPDLCCEIRKVEPNRRALEGKSAWVTGLRRDQSDGRAAIPIVAWNEKFGVVKVSPLATWTEKDAWAYIMRHQVPYNPLLDRGYASIGCYNCTLPGKPGRAGRWTGFEKEECGLHV